MIQSNSIAEHLPSYTRSAFIINANANVPPPRSCDLYSYTASAQLEFNTLSATQKKALYNGFAIAASSTEGKAELKDAARVAVEAAERIFKMFRDMDVKLRAFDVGPDWDWEQVIMWAMLIQLYRVLITESRKVAIAIAEYATSFEDVVLKFCADATLSVADRLKEIDRFIAKSDDIKKSAQRMEDQFQGLQDELAKFVSQFARHARDLPSQTSSVAGLQTEQQRQIGIQDICKELARVDKAVKDIDGAMRAFNAREEVLESAEIESKLRLPIAGLVAFGVHPSSPWIIGVGAAIAGVQIGAVTGLATARNVAMEDRRKKGIELTNLLEPTVTTTTTTADSDESQAIAAAAAHSIQIKLEQGVFLEFKEFADLILMMQKFWLVTANDAGLIRLWLEDGADYVKYPEYMKLSLLEGVQVYKAMAEYLMVFAEGVDPLVGAIAEVTTEE